MWQGREIITPHAEGLAFPQRGLSWARILKTLAVGIEEQLAITAFHHVAAEFAKVDGAGAQIVSLPAAFGNAFDAEQNGGDFAIGGFIETPIECPKREHITVTLLLGETRRIGRKFTAVEGKP